MAFDKLVKNIDIGFDFKFDRLPDTNRFKQVMSYNNDNIQDEAWKNITVLNGLPFYFDVNYKNVMVSWSAGADSTMVLYMLLRLIEYYDTKTNVHLLNFVRHWSGDFVMTRTVDTCLDYIRTRFPKINITFSRCFLPPAFEMLPATNVVAPEDRHKFEEHILQGNADLILTQSYSAVFKNKHSIETSYGGITMNPIAIADKDVNAPTFRNERNVSDVNSYDCHSMERGFFSFINKDFVMAQYENFGIQELRELTRSCSIPLIDKKYDFVRKLGVDEKEIKGNKHTCDTCFFCEERSWAESNKEYYLEEFHK